MPVIELGDRVLDLEPGVHLHEVIIPISIEELHRSCIPIIGDFCHGDCRFGHPVAEFGGHDRAGSFLDKFLVTPLDGAFPVIEVDRRSRARRPGSGTRYAAALSWYFSIKTVESPKADSAIRIPALMASSRAASSLTICIPIPPPPALAFTMTG